MCLVLTRNPPDVNLFIQIVTGEEFSNSSSLKSGGMGDLASGGGSILAEEGCPLSARAGARYVTENPGSTSRNVTSIGLRAASALTEVARGAIHLALRVCRGLYMAGNN
jgi:hypothetical protein